MSTYHYTLSEKQSILWNHCNPDMQRWGYKLVLNAVVGVAPNHETVKIYDTDESYLATVLDSSRWIGQVRLAA